MLQYYRIEITNVNPLKPKVMKLTYTRFFLKYYNNTFCTYNTIKSIFNELKALNDEKHGTLIKPHDQLQLIVIDDFFLIDNKILTFIHCRLRVIKQVHNQFMGGLDIIMTGNLYQAALVRDSWIFKSKTKPLA